MSGLTATQDWTHSHIVRCRSCGAWEVVPHTELERRALEIDAPPATCRHTNPEAMEAS